MLGRRGLALLYGGFGAIQYLPLRQLRQRGVLLFLREIPLPAGCEGGSDLDGEYSAAALQRNGSFCIAVGVADRTEKLPCHKAQKLALAQRQDGGIRLARAGGRKDSVVVADLFAVADRPAFTRPGASVSQITAATAASSGTEASRSSVRKQLSVRG